MITLKTLPQATAQEVFDQVVNHLKTQNAKSSNPASCAYRSFDGLKCAAGCLIGDDEYKPEMENPPYKDNSAWPALVATKMVPKEHKTLITSLQTVHDKNYCDTDFYLNCVNGLRRVAEQFNLEFNE